MVEVNKALSHVISTRILPELGFEKITGTLWETPTKNSFKPHTSDGVGGIKHQIIIVHGIDRPDFSAAKSKEEIVAALQRHLRKETKCGDIVVGKIGASYFIKHPEINVPYAAQ